MRFYTNTHQYDCESICTRGRLVEGNHASERREASTAAAVDLALRRLRGERPGLEKREPS